FDQRNAKVKKYSAFINRTPSALAMKLSNFASLDPMITSSGRKGLEGASKIDKAIWQEMNSNWGKFTQEMLEVVSLVTQSDEVAEIESLEDLTPLSSFVGKERVIQTRARVGQNVFRKFVLSSYNFQCCISELSVPRLLVASHIVPWKDNEENRLNPRNGLCLSMIHDKAFDLGMITVTENLKVKVSSKYHSAEDRFFKDSLSSFDGKGLVLPDKFSPDKEFLAYHRDVVFESKTSA
ncbi:MAG: HNH endonuclease, partial [Leucothrix sp.]